MKYPPAVRTACEAALVVLLVAAGCRPERDVTHATGALQAVIDAYDDKDAHALWGLCSARTHELLTEAHAGLVELQGIISSDFPVGQRKKALHAAGATLLVDAASPEALFVKIASLDKIKFGGGTRYGAEVTESVVDVQAGAASFQTQAGQQWVLRRDASGAWKTIHLETLLEAQLAKVKKNLETARAFAKTASDHEAAVDVRVKELKKGR